MNSGIKLNTLYHPNKSLYTPSLAPLNFAAAVAPSHALPTLGCTVTYSSKSAVKPRNNGFVFSGSEREILVAYGSVAGYH
jgi:hypothetical protein